MIDHIVLFRIKEGAADADVQALIDALYAVSRLAPGVESYRLQRDARLRDGNDDLALVARFRDRDAFEGYLSHPEHLAPLAKYAPGLLADKHSVQFESGAVDGSECLIYIGHIHHDLSKEMS